jgi:hypothetical protein
MLIPRWQKVPVAALTVRLKDKATNARTALKESVRLFKPETVIGWHQAMVRRKWTFKQGRKPGRPPIDSELEGWILQVARDNPGLGFEKLEGELRKVGLEVSATTIRTVYNDTTCRLRRNAHGRAAPGARFWPITKTSFWRATFLPWRRSRCRPCMCFFSLSMAHARCISRGAPRIQSSSG